jgi:hypothetical protein
VAEFRLQSAASFGLRHRRVGAGADTRRRAWQLSVGTLLLGMKLVADGCRLEQDRLPAPALSGADPCPVGW